MSVLNKHNLIVPKEGMACNQGDRCPSMQPDGEMVTVDESNQGVWAGELENGWLYRTVAAQ